uniref:tRNA N(3)-cytidine methyltransferase n=1 Tax=Mustela putorius furo TaxID=9669 RepID=M3YUP9_MUSPF
MADSHPECASAAVGEKRQQFGSRFLSDPARVFHHNAWDNVEWSEEQAAAAERKVQENSTPRVCQEKQVDYEVNAHKYWNEFYKIHENGFFKDRHWLFTEFPELAPNPNHNDLNDWLSENKRSEVPEGRRKEEGPGLKTEEQHTCSSDSLGHKTQMPPLEEDVTRKLSHLEIRADEFPGSSATYRILEVSRLNCSVFSAHFSDPGLFVYCCDFSSTAIELVRTNSAYDPRRCFAFVHDLCDEDATYPVPGGSLDVIILIFVLSAVVPDKMQKAIGRLSRLLKPGGMMLLRDYGRYDMAQLRFKKGQCLSESFYVRGDGTRVYFFTQEELDTLFTTAGLEKVQNLVDRRLQVNRGKQLTMYRVWIQCKYRKPLVSGAGPEPPVPDRILSSSAVF